MDKLLDWFADHPRIATCMFPLWVLTIAVAYGTVVYFVTGG